MNELRHVSVTKKHEKEEPDKWNRPAVSFETNSLKEGSRKSENSQNPLLDKKTK